MRILIVCQYFWPENFRINDIAIGLQEKGHEVTVFTGKPNYPAGKFFPRYSFLRPAFEKWNGISIYRVPLLPRGTGGVRLMLNYLSFVFFGCWKALFLSLKTDVVFVYQLSPVTMALPGIIFKKKNKVEMCLYIQDLWPQSVVAAGNVTNRLVLWLLRSVTSYIYNQTDKLLIQSRAFRDYLVDNKQSNDKIIYVPNSTEPFYRRTNAPENIKQYFTGTINLVFAGNIGEVQGLHTFLEAAKIIHQTDPDICWIMIGNGRKKDELEQRANAYGISQVFKFIGSFPSEEMPGFFEAADALLISLVNDPVLSLTVPSKLQSYMACGKPVVGLLDGEGRKIIEEAKCGLTAPAGDVHGLLNILRRFKSMTDMQRRAMGINGENYFNREFNRRTLIDRLDSILSGTHEN